ncbi:hypothetical protein Tco_0011674 [Tanacetum coccineum]
MENLHLKYGLVSRTYYKKSLIMASTFGSKSKSFMTMSVLSQDEPLTNRPVVSFVNKNANESWEIIENLALYGHEGWNDVKEFVKPVKVISTPQGISKMPDQRLLELEDQINFLLKGS